MLLAQGGERFPNAMYRVWEPNLPGTTASGVLFIGCAFWHDLLLCLRERKRV